MDTLFGDDSGASSKSSNNISCQGNHRFDHNEDQVDSNAEISVSDQIAESLDTLRRLDKLIFEQQLIIARNGGSLEDLGLKPDIN